MFYKRLMALFGLFVFGIGCTESGELISSTTTPSADASPSAGPNGIHNGTIWVSDTDGTRRINLRTGHERLISIQNAYPTRDGSFYVRRDDNGSRQDPNCNHRRHDDVTRITVADTHARESISQFDSIRRIIGPIRLAPDIERVAMFGSEIEACDTNFNNIRLMVFSINGKELQTNLGRLRTCR